ncbi:hypothetical protein IKF15_03160 [Candidatus Saccharibacteria bacterium]|nr:hypothetical protein [Candidatus Saccharibacteria bacterium]
MSLFLALGLGIFANYAVYADSADKVNVKVLVNNVANPMTNTYKLRISPKSSNPAGAANEPSEVIVDFSGAQSDESGKVEKDVVIDFSDTTYREKGVYEYDVEEVFSSDATNYPVSAKKYRISVEMKYKMGELVKTVYGLGWDYDKGEKANLVFDNVTKMTYFAIETRTEGAQADKDEYFKYKVVIDGKPGDKFVISGQDAKVVFDGEEVETTNFYEVKEGGDNYVYVYLKADQVAKIGLGCPTCADGGFGQIPIGTNVSVEKIGSRKWQTTINGREVIFSGKIGLAENGAENMILVVHKKNFDVALTGILMNFWPFVVLVGIGGAGIGLLMKTKKRNAEKNS